MHHHEQFERFDNIPIYNTMTCVSDSMLFLSLMRLLLQTFSRILHSHVSQVFSGPMFHNALKRAGYILGFRPCLGPLSVTPLRHIPSRGSNNAISQYCRFFQFHC